MGLSDFVKDFVQATKDKEARRQERNTIRHDKFDRGDYNAITSELAIMRSRTEDLGQIAGEDLAEGASEDSFYTFYKAEVEARDDKNIRPSFLINKHVMGEAIGLPEYERLRLSSTLDLINSGLSFSELEPKLETIYDKLKEQIQASRELEQMMQQYGEGHEEMEGLAEALAEAMEGSSEAEDLSDRLAAAREALEKLEQEMENKAGQIDEKLDLESVQIRETLAEGMKEAEDQVDRLENMSSWGLEPGSIHRVPPAKRIELAKRLDNEKYRKIADLIGPMTRLALTEQSRKTVYARNEIYDVTIGSDLAHVLAVEFIELEDDIMFLDFCRKLYEGSLLQYELKGREHIDRGNIIFCEDGSGSMGGAREIWAKACSGALLTIARRQNRGFTGIHFGSPNEYMQFDFDFKGDKTYTSYCHPRDKNAKAEYNTLDGILHWMEIFFNSGTDFMTPLQVSLDMLEAQHKAEGQIDGDIVFCTDGMCNVNDEWLTKFKERQAFLGFNVWGIVIGGSRDMEPLKTICDGKVFNIQDLYSGEDVRNIFRGV